MTQRFGDRARFCVEVGELTSPDLRVVDLWAAGKRLTVDDNTAFVPSFSPHIRATGEWVRRRGVKPCPFPGRAPEDIYRLLWEDDTEFAQDFWFLQWGETVDNVLKYAYLDDDLVMMFEFWRDTHPFPEEQGKIFVARIPPDEFADVVEQAADLLDAETAR